MRYLVTTLAVATLLWASPSAKAGFLVVEGWESVALAPGSLSATPAPGWAVFTGASFSGVYRPGAAEFTATSPLAAPAGGNNALVLSGVNTGWSYTTTALIQPNTVYTLSAAIGNSTIASDHNNWSLQLWADTNNNGAFDGGGFDTFLGQQFGTNPTALAPALGAWRTNSYQFDSATNPLSVGSRLIVFLNNFNTGTSYYDSVTLSTPDAVTATPLPPSVLLLIAGFMGLPLWSGVRTRRGSRSPSPQ